MPKQRLLVGMLIAPLFAGTFYVILTTTLNWVLGVEMPSLLELGADVVFVCIYTYPIGWLLGLPSYAAYQWLGLNSLASYLLGGLIGGCLVAAWLVLPFPEVPEIWVPMVLSASASCVLFWLIVVREVNAT